MSVMGSLLGSGGGGGAAGRTKGNSDALPLQTLMESFGVAPKLAQQAGASGGSVGGANPWGSLLQAGLQAFGASPAALQQGLSGMGRPQPPPAASAPGLAGGVQGALQALSPEQMSTLSSSMEALGGSAQGLMAKASPQDQASVVRYVQAMSGSSGPQQRSAAGSQLDSALGGMVAAQGMGQLGNAASTLLGSL